MKVLKEVFCRLRFSAFHRWTDAPCTVEFLKALHRHQFHVQVNVLVSGVNREVEFLTLKEEVNKVIDKLLTDDHYDWSCEMWSFYIRTELVVAYKYVVTRVEVSEDGENGAILTFETEKKEE